MFELMIVKFILALSLSMVQPTTEPQTTLTIGENCYVVDIEDGKEYENERVNYITYEDVTTYWD
jgi:hypothetical protein